MVVVQSMAAAAATSMDMVRPTVMQNKHRIRYRRRGPAFGDGCGTGITGFAPVFEPVFAVGVFKGWFIEMRVGASGLALNK